MSSYATPRTSQSARTALEHKTCLVTGSSRGIGREIALELARHGAAVAVNFHSAVDAAHEVRAEIAEMGEEAILVQADVSDPGAVDRLAGIVHDEFGEIDVLVNNAGLTRDTTFEQMSHDEWQTVLDVNLGGAFNCTKAFYDDIKDADEGRIISISSVVGQQGNIGQANYAASKSALVGFTKTLALELARTGSTANCIAPGFTETDMLEHVPDKVREKILQDVPVDRFAEPAEVAGLARYLASDESSYITGQELAVNGGMYR